MFARGLWDWHTFNTMVDMHLRFEQEDHERLTAVLTPEPL